MLNELLLSIPLTYGNTIMAGGGVLVEVGCTSKLVLAAMSDIHSDEQTGLLIEGTLRLKIVLKIGINP